MTSARYFFQHRRAPGDTIALTAFLRDLRHTDPDCEIGLNATAADELLLYDPTVSRLPADAPGVTRLRLDYLVDRDAAMAGACIAYIESFHRDFHRQTGIQVPLTSPQPALYLTDEERATRPFPFPYWLVCAGGKTDLPTKIWSRSGYQGVLARTPDIRWVQVGHRGDARIQHIHYPLQGAIDCIGQTTLRQLMTWVYHAQGVLCGATQLLLMAQAFHRPCVAVIGGRESYTWLAYARDNPAWGSLVSQIAVPHRVLHTIGQLACCAQAGCWASQVIAPHHASPFPPGYLCSQPSQDSDGTPLPACMHRVGPDEVAAAVRSYASSHPS